MRQGGRALYALARVHITLEGFVSDRRIFPRLPLAVEVELYTCGELPAVVRTEDLSNGGAFLVLKGVDLPPMGSRVQVRVVGPLGGGEPAPLVDALVVRHAPDGVAVQFIDKPAV
ncbi:PilZ domain-containing protein [Thiorhodococcus drewsii]|uniref:PilZ domain-containing protein n=1 Tax=Thiorhodococcus drewsii TaxID=210408 RepID=UPI001111AAAD|nr:PilZ domain-containing protein [Thiorhodococcus drewsii]